MDVPAAANTLGILGAVRGPFSHARPRMVMRAANIFAGLLVHPSACSSLASLSLPLAVHMHIHMHIRTYVYIYVYMYMYMYVCVCGVYAYVYLYMQPQ